MGCSHNYVVGNGYFACTKCGHISYGSAHRRRGKIAAVTVIGLAMVALLAYYGGILNLEEVGQPLQDIPESLPDEISDIEIPASVPLPDELKRVLPGIPEMPEFPSIPEIPKEIPGIPESVKQAISPELDVAEIERLVHEGINGQRELHGLGLLEYDAQIADIARAHSRDMARNDYFEHASLDGREPWDRGFPHGYHTCGTMNQFGGLAENIFQTWTYDSITYVNLVPIHDWNTEEDIARQAVEGWMDSPGHRQNILSGFYSEGIGIAIAPDDKVYVTQNFC